MFVGTLVVKKCCQIASGTFRSDHLHHNEEIPLSGVAPNVILFLEDSHYSFIYLCICFFFIYLKNAGSLSSLMYFLSLSEGVSSRSSKGWCICT